MDPAQFFASFRALHHKARQGVLDATDRQKYLGMGEELARSLMKAQGQTVAQGLPARRQLRVSHLFQVEVANLYQTMTRELSCAGFSAVVTGALTVGDQVSWSLTPGRAMEPIIGTARVASCDRAAGGSYRVACEFGTLDEARLARLELAVLDAALARIP